MPTYVHHADFNNPVWCCFLLKHCADGLKGSLPGNKQLQRKLKPALPIETKSIHRYHVHTTNWFGGPECILMCVNGCLNMSKAGEAGREEFIR